MKFKLFLSGLIISLAAVTVSAQTPREEYIEKYNRLVQKVGASGLGIETLLDKWLAEYPEDIDANLGRFLFEYSKSQTSKVVQKDTNKYLGQAPVLSLADSLGNKANYFEELFFDDELFGKALTSIDKVIRMAPDRIDLRYYKVSALVGYEKEKPELALNELKGIIDYNVIQKPKWTHPEYEVNEDFFLAAIQDYCVLFFKYETPAAYEAFGSLVQRVLDYYPKKSMFLSDMGSYWFVYKKDYKKALKYYNQALKINPKDNVAIRSCVMLCRNTKDTKLEKKYLEMMVKYAEKELDRQSAQVRLDFLNGKK